MPDAYELHEARLIQYSYNASAADALIVASAAVPANKIKTILCAMVTCSVAETQDYWFAIYGRNGIEYPVTIRREVIITPAVNGYYNALSEGMELRLYPSEYLLARRDVATAGSTISLYTRFIESDLPLYEYIEPQQRKRIAQARRDIFAAISRAGGPLPPRGSPPGGAGRLPPAM